MLHLFLLILLLGLPISIVGQACNLPVVPEIDSALIPTGFIPSAFEVDTCNGITLVQMAIGDPVVVLRKATFECKDGQWSTDQSTILPARMSCVTPPSDWDQSSYSVRYYYQGGAANIIPLLPEYNYCPANRRKFEINGVEFKSITGVSYNPSNFMFYYDAELANGTIVRWSSYGTNEFLKVYCAEELSCTAMPEISSNLIPSDFTPSDLRRVYPFTSNGSVKCNGITLVQLAVGDPVVALRDTTFQCNSGQWSTTDSTILPARMTCVTPPADFNQSSYSVRYYYLGGAANIIPLLPEYDYCRENTRKLEANGIEFKSITGVSYNPSNFMSYYDAELADGTIVRWSTYGGNEYLKVYCAEELSCNAIPEISSDLIPSDFTPSDLRRVYPFTSNGSVKCNGITLVQLVVGDPVVVLRDTEFECKDGQWSTEESDILPARISCVTAPSDWNQSSYSVRYYYNGGAAHIIPLLPEYNYCPDNKRKFYVDGREFKSITGVSFNPSTGMFDYDALLADGTVGKWRTYGNNEFLKVFCGDELTCTAIPEIPTELVPSDFEQTDLLRIFPIPADFVMPFKCRGLTLVQFYTDGPVVAMYKNPYFECASGEWSWETTQTSMMPISVSCVTKPENFSDCGVEYYAPELRAYVIPLLPGYEYCPGNRKKIMSDGTPFNSIVCDGTESTGSGTRYLYNVTLADGTVERRTTWGSEYFRIFCEVELPSCEFPILPEIPANLIPSGFEPGTHKPAPSGQFPPGYLGHYTCADIALVQLKEDGPVVAQVEPIFQCKEGLWTTEAELPPVSMSCAEKPVDFDRDCVVSYYTPDGTASIIPIHPDYKYCTDNKISVLGDGTPFKSLTCAGTNTTEGGTLQHNYDVVLEDGTIQSRYAWDTQSLGIYCKVPLTCALPVAPEIPENQIPEGMESMGGLLELYSTFYEQSRYGCPFEYALAQIEVDGPFVLTYAYYGCENNQWVDLESDSTILPLQMICVEAFDYLGDCPVNYILPNGNVSILPLHPDYVYCPENRQSILEDGTPFSSAACGYDDNGVYSNVTLLDGTIIVKHHGTDGLLAVKCGDITTTTTTTTLATTTTTPDLSRCPTGGVWSEWQTTGTCSATCGSCGVAQRTRTCIKNCGDCPCTGPSEDIGPCGLAQCPYPAPICCQPYKRTINYRSSSYFCGDGVIINAITCKAPETTTAPITGTITTTMPSPTTTGTTMTTRGPAACPAIGVWGEWTEVGTCATTCGGCSTIKRTRVCRMDYCGNCPCVGPSEDIGPCGLALCPYPAVNCCNQYKKTTNYRTGAYFCGDGVSIPYVECKP